MDDATANPLIAAYLERREDLLRYFRARLRSEEAAQDLVQDIFLKVQSLPHQEIGNPGAFLYRLGTNLMLDQIKQRARSGRRDAAWRDSAVTEVGGEDIAPAPPADEALAARQTLARVLEAVDRLPPNAARAFRLHKLEGLSHAETAQAMGVSRSSVEKHIMAALKAIHARLERR